MMKASNVPIVTSTATSMATVPVTSGSKVLSDAVAPLTLGHTELKDSGLLRSITAEAGEMTRAIALNAERAALILLIQNVITGYVMSKEGRGNYRGKGHYDLAYIQNSAHINIHRKNDIRAIDGLLNEAEAKALPPVSLGSALFKYLNQIKTGVNFLWLVRIGSSSGLRSHIHTGLKGFDPILYWVCFIDQVDDYQSYQAQKPNGTKLRLARSMEAEISKTAVSFEKYQLLRKAITTLKRELAEVKNQHAELEEENVAMSSLINRQKTRIHELEGGRAMEMKAHLGSKDKGSGTGVHDAVYEQGKHPQPVSM